MTILTGCQCYNMARLSPIFLCFSLSKFIYAWLETFLILKHLETILNYVKGLEKGLLSHSYCASTSSMFEY